MLMGFSPGKILPLACVAWFSCALVPVAAQQAAPSAPAATPAAAPGPDAGPDPMTLLNGSASCFLPPLAIDPSAVTAFRNTPQDLLSPYPEGGTRMTQDVRGLAGTDVSTVPMLLELAKAASPGQTAAIGAGLAQTARACVRQRPDVAQIIQQMIIRANLGPLTTAFLSSSGDTATAATGAAAGGAAAGAGAGAISGSPGGGDTSGLSGGVASAGGAALTRARNTATVSTLGAGGSTVTFNITLGGGSVSPVR